MKRDRRSGRGRGEDESGPVKLPRRDYLLRIRRAPALWDIAFFWLSRALTAALRKERSRIRGSVGLFNDSELVIIGLLAAKGLESSLRVACGVATREGEPYVLAELTPDRVRKIAKDVEPDLASILACYREATRDEYVPPRHPNLVQLASALARAIEQFLIEGCMPGGEHHASLARPLDDPGEFFPKPIVNDPRVLPSGDLNRDVYRLGPVVEDDDGPDQIKTKLIAFAQVDPWLAPLKDLVVDDAIKKVRREAESERELSEGINSGTVAAIDGLLFRHSIPLGQTPIEHWLERQPLLSQQQRTRLERMNQLVFDGVFRVEGFPDPDSMRLWDIQLGRELLIRGDPDKQVAQMFRDTDYVHTRLTPFDDHWRLSGVQRPLPVPKQKRRTLELEVKKQRLHRRLDRSEPNIQRTFEEGKRWYDAWVKLFGADESLFATGLDAAAAMSRHFRYMRDELVHPATGMTPREAFLRDHGVEPPQVKDPLPEHLLDAKDVSVLCDPEWGTQILVDYGAVLRALQSDGAPPAREVALLREFFLEPSVDWWVLARLGKRFSRRFEEFVRLALPDPEFHLHELDVLLRKFKGEQLRLGPIPTTLVTDIGEDLLEVERQKEQGDGENAGQRVEE